MTVVEAYAGKKKMSPPSDADQMHKKQSTLVIEGVAVNTTGSVFAPKVFLSFPFYVWFLF